MQFPKDVLDIIMRYKADLELLEKQPRPCILQYCNPTSICCYDRFVTERLLELLYSRAPLYEVRQCVKCLLKIPANIFLNYQTACQIYSQRCALYNIDPTDREFDYWSQTLPTILDEFLCDNDLQTMYHKVNDCLSADYIYNLRLTESW